VFGTQGQQYGNGVVHVALPGDIVAVDILPSGYSTSPTLAAAEVEVPVNVLPTQFARQASVTITAEQARGILQGMGINIPANITYQGSALTNYLQSLPSLTPAQIQNFVQRAATLSRK
jgi:hypothetical protein